MISFHATGLNLYINYMLVSHTWIFEFWTGINDKQNISIKSVDFFSDHIWPLHPVITSCMANLPEPSGQSWSWSITTSPTDKLLLSCLDCYSDDSFAIQWGIQISIFSKNHRILLKCCILLVSSIEDDYVQWSGKFSTLQPINIINRMVSMSLLYPQWK